MQTTADRLKFIMRERNLKQVDILKLCKPYCERYGVKLNKSALSEYVSGRVAPGSFKLTVLGLALGVSEVWLMGYDVPMERNTAPQPSEEQRPASITVPRLGAIACGAPIFAEENIEAYETIPAWTRADFTLVCRGDSMTGARIYDGDIVCIRSQQVAENGQIAAVLIDEMEGRANATLKRIRFLQGGIALWPENPNYEPMIFMGEDANRVRIIGVATHFISEVI